jgi:hypothetical protein
MASGKKAKTKTKKAEADFLSKLIYVAAYGQPLMTLPQVYEVWVNDQPASLVTWGAYLFFAVIWFAYALKTKNKPLIITYSLWLVAEGALVLGLVVQMKS